VRGVPAQATQVTITARLAPRVFLAKGTRMDTSASATFAVSRCQMSVVSGPPVREAEEPRILVKMLDRCRSNARLRWMVDTTPAEVVREAHSNEADYLLLRTSSLASGSVTIAASRSDATGGVIGSVVVSTMRSPRPVSTLELPGLGPIADAGDPARPRAARGDRPGRGGGRAPLGCLRVPKPIHLWRRQPCRHPLVASVRAEHLDRKRRHEPVRGCLKSARGPVARREARHREGRESTITLSLGERAG
jgi:hypothetical protein